MSRGWLRAAVATGAVAIALSGVAQSGATSQGRPALEPGAPDPAAGATDAAAYVPAMTFDVASVRENKDADLRAGITMSGQFVPHTTMLRMVNWRIESLISAAYGIDEYQIAGSPKWPFPTVFVVEAKGDTEADAKMAALPVDEQRMEQKHMFQALLAERFRLKTHWETKPGDVYNLVVAKGGPKMGAAGSMPPSAKELSNFGDHPVPSLYQRNSGRGYDWVGHGCSMQDLASILRSMMGRPVTDKTGLPGTYDFVLKYNGRTEHDRSADDTDPTPPLDRAVEDELGLKLEAAKGPVQALVIDHIEKPTEN